MMTTMYRSCLKHIRQYNLKQSTKISVYVWLRHQISLNFQDKNLSTNLYKAQIITNLQQKISLLRKFNEGNQTILNCKQMNSKEMVQENVEAIIVYIIACIQQIIQKKYSQHLERVGMKNQQILNSFISLLKDFLLIRNSIKQDKVNIEFVKHLIIQVLSIFSQNSIQNQQSLNQLIWLLQIDCKIIYTMKYILPAVNQAPDITTQSIQNNKDFWEKVVTQKNYQSRMLQLKMKFLKKIMEGTTFFVLKQKDYHNLSLKEMLKIGRTFGYYFLNMKYSRLQIFKFYRNPSLQIAQRIWNLPQQGLFRNFTELTFPKIVYNKVFYVPINSSQSDTKSIFQFDIHKIPVRILYNQNLDKLSQKSQKINKAIIHMHGGGFIALSSFSEQNFLRKWSKDLNVPVFSIDYRMPPQHLFPTAPQDCLKAYKFILQYAQQKFNIKPENIILAGDSAGGNLTFSLMTLILKQNLQKPIGIYTAYPALDLRESFSRSKLNIINDPLFYPQQLLICLKEYLKNHKNAYNPLASPILLSSSFISESKDGTSFPQNWPLTIIHVGTRDALYDDSIKIAHRMYKSKIDIKVKICKDLPHGFLNLDSAMKESKDAVEDSVTFIKQLFQSI